MCVVAPGLSVKYSDDNSNEKGNGVSRRDWRAVLIIVIALLAALCAKHSGVLFIAGCLLVGKKNRAGFTLPGESIFWLLYTGPVDQLNLQVTSGHAERTEGGAEQHRGGATVGNPRNTWAEERPPRKTIPTSCRWNGDNAA